MSAVASDRLRVGIRIPACRPVSELTEAAVDAERLGFDHVWFPDSQLLWRDVFCTLTAAAALTRRIGLGTAVTNVVTRHVTVIASAARTVAELAPGRFTLGLGVGNSSLAPIGLPPSKGREMRHAIAVIRELLAGGEHDFGGGAVRLRDPAPAVAVHMAATGPRNLRLAGELADGVILLSGVAPAALDRATAMVGEGVAASGRARREVGLTVSAYCHVTDDVYRDARLLKPICAGMAQNGGTEVLRRVGIEAVVPERADDVYPDLVHAEDWDHAVDVCGRWISDDDAVRFAEVFCLFGTGDQIAERLARTRAAGATGVLLQHVGSYDVPSQLMRDVARDVLPRLAEEDMVAP